MAVILPATDDEYQSFRDETCRAFDRWLGAKGSEATAPELGLLLDWKWSYGDGHLDRLTRDELEEFLLGWCPRKLSAAGAEVADLPYTIASGVQFLSEEGILRSGDSRAQLADHARRLATAFVEAMDDPANFGMAKSLFASIGLTDPAAMSPEDLQRAIDEFNWLPQDQRTAITDIARQEFAREPVVIGPVVEPSAEALRASAEKAPVLHGFREIADYLGPDGKTLTKTGALKLADARALVERLGTGEKFELEIGDLTYQKRSARDLPHLDHWHWWAMEAGAVRLVRGRLVPVKAWEKRVRDDPAAEARKAAAALLSFGAGSTFQARSLTQLPYLLDQAIAMLLSPLLTMPGPLEFAELVDQFEEVAESEDVPYLSTPILSMTLSRVLGLLERAGVIEQSELETERSEIGSDRTVGGKIAITPLGVVALMDELRRQGVEVTTLADLASTTFDDLVAMIGREDVLPREWWQLVGAWLGDGPGRALDSTEAADALKAVPTTLLMLEETAPEELRPSFLNVLRRIADQGTPQDPPTAAALTTLAAVDPGLVDGMSEDLRDQLLVTMIGLTGLDGPEEAMESLAGAGADRAFELIKVAGRFPCPSSEATLDLIGDWYPDKKIAKAARKELFRLRSKLAAARS
ncbi:hypothetical protein [Microlunatus sp. GCM10028923]|uniref:hypothetical protein n=1 Tax=Microlunatus sp. GCM10028923 TaxID=3273400 RepID=UPI0036216581